jgi:hypothetical protein
MAEKADFPMALDQEAPTEDERSVLLTFSSEKPVLRGDHYEILSHDLGAVDLSKLQSEAPVLVDHAGDRVGTVMDAWLGNRCGVARVRLDRSEVGEKMLQAVNDEVLWGVSVGCRYPPEARVFSPDIDGVTAFWVAYWTPHEISLSSKPADPTVGVGRVRNEDRYRWVLPKEEIVAAKERKYVVRPASDFELVEKRGNTDQFPGMKLSQGEFDLLFVLKKHDPEKFRVVYKAMWWERQIKNWFERGVLTNGERDKLAAEIKAMQGEK